MKALFFAALLSASASAQVIEDFEHGNESLYALLNGGDTMNIVASSAHDGAFGAEFATSGSSGWRLRTDVPTAPGNVYECFVRARGSATVGRTYIGVGASAGGAWSAVFAPNTSQILLQNNLGFGFTSVATAPVSYSVDTWYRLRLDWAANGDMTVELLDETGPNVIATTGPVATGYTTAGGVALRGFTSTGTIHDLDTVRRVNVLPPVTYCTAGTSTNGCVPALSASGQPSASAATPCTLSVANLEGQKQGLIFYGLDNSGFSPLPWSSTSTSFFCVKSPTQRTLPQTSGGTLAQCDGAFTLDWNNFLATFAALGEPFAAGDKLYAQGWYRDPPASKTTNLTNAVELTFVP
jgi:hypothetical protein